MRRGLRVLLLWALVLWVLMIGGAAVAEQTPSCTITVQPGESIQAAIDAAPEGAVICLPAGEWQAELRISKSLTLRGAGAPRTTIRGKSLDGPVVQVHRPASVVAVEDLTVTGAKGEGAGHGIIVNDAVVVTVSRCVISSNAVHGVVLIDRSQGIISDSTIQDNLKNGVVTYHNAHALIIDSAVSHNGWSGVTVEKDAEADVASCTISNNGAATGGMDSGIVVVDNARATITACAIFENRILGIAVRGPGQAVITGCSISKTKGAATGGDGIQLMLSAHATISGCTIFENGRHGIALKDSAEADIESCRIFLNGSYGLALVERPCFAMDAVFAGRAAGRENAIPSPTEPDGNKLGAVCPGALAFLMTPEGGELDRRPH